MNYARLVGALSNGAEIRETTLTESFDFDDYYRKYYKRAIPLFAIDARGRLHVFTAERKLVPGPEWILLSLVEPEPGIDEHASLEQDLGKQAGNEPDNTVADN